MYVFMYTISIKYFGTTRMHFKVLVGNNFFENCYLNILFIIFFQFRVINPYSW